MVVKGNYRQLVDRIIKKLFIESKSDLSKSSTNQSIKPSTNQSPDQLINQSPNPSIYQSPDPPMYLSSDLPIYQSPDSPICQSPYQLINQLQNPSMQIPNASQSRKLASMKADEIERQKSDAKKLLMNYQYQLIYKKCIKDIEKAYNNGEYQIYSHSLHENHIMLLKRAGYKVRNKSCCDSWINGRNTYIVSW